MSQQQHPRQGHPPAAAMGNGQPPQVAQPASQQHPHSNPHGIPHTRSAPPAQTMKQPFVSPQMYAYPNQGFMPMRYPPQYYGQSYVPANMMPAAVMHQQSPQGAAGHPAAPAAAAAAAPSPKAAPTQSAPSSSHSTPKRTHRLKIVNPNTREEIKPTTPKQTRRPLGGDAPGSPAGAAAAAAPAPATPAAALPAATPAGAAAAKPTTPASKRLVIKKPTESTKPADAASKPPSSKPTAAAVAAAAPAAAKPAAPAAVVKESAPSAKPAATEPAAAEKAAAPAPAKAPAAGKPAPKSAPAATAAAKATEPVKAQPKVETTPAAEPAAPTTPAKTDGSEAPAGGPSPSRRVLMNVPYGANQWKPSNQGGQRVYSLEFLKQFRPLVQEKPKDMAKDVNDMLGRRQPVQRKSRPAGGGGGVQNLSFLGNVGGKGRSSQAPRPAKVINLPKISVKPLEANENAWKAHNLKGVELNAADEILKKAQGILNRLTIEKFAKLSDQLIELGMQLPDDQMDQFISKVFSKAVDEPFFSGMYAQLCKKMSSSKSIVDTKEQLMLPQFRRMLLNRCQKEFEKDRAAEAEQAQRKIQSETVNDPTKSKEENEKMEKERIAEENYKLATERRHMFGNIKFIGELFKLDMVSETIIHKECISRLLKDDADEDVLECLCKLLETAGFKLDAGAGKAKGGKEGQKTKSRLAMDEYMGKLLAITRRKGLPSRIKFMIQDLVEQRQRNWVARREAAGPTTIEAVRLKAAQDALKKQQQQQQSRMGGGGDRGGDRRNNRRTSRGGPGPSYFARSQAQQQQQDNWQVVNRPAIDKSKFAKLSKREDGGEVKLGGVRKSWGTGAGGKKQQGAVIGGRYTPRGAAPDSGRNLANAFSLLEPGSASPNPARKELGGDGKAEPEEAAEEETTKFTDEVMQRKNKGTIEEYLGNKDAKEVIECLKELECTKGIVLFVKQAVLYGLEHKENDVKQLCVLLADLCKAGIVTAAIVDRGFDEPLNLLSDLAIDSPMAPGYMAWFIAASVLAGTLSMGVFDLEFMTTMFGDSPMKLVLKTLKAVKQQASEEKMMELAKTLSKPIKDFLEEDRRHDGSFERLTQREDIEALNQLASSAETADAGVLLPASIEAGLATMLRDGKENAEITDWILKGVSKEAVASPAFVRALVGTIMEACKADGAEPTAEAIAREKELATPRCLLIRKYTCIGKPDEATLQLQLHAICSVQGYCSKHAFPKGLLERWFDLLYNEADIPEDAFLAWETESEVSKSALYAAKGAALVQATDFLEMLKEESET